MRRSATDLDLNLLRVLVELYRARNVSRAAEALGLSQPATSLALQRLRRALNDPLFVRTAGGILPTARCAKVVRGAQRALQAVKIEVLDEPAFEPATSARQFTFNMNDVGEMALLPKIVGFLGQQAPSCNVRSETLPIHDLDAALRSGRVDLALGYFPELDRRGLFRQQLFSRSYACLVRSGHPDVQGGRIPLRAFMKLSHVLIKPEGRSEDLFEAALQKEDIRRRVHLVTRHFMSLPEILSNTDLVATVPDTLARHFSRVAGLQIAQPPIRSPRYAVSQHWDERFHHDPALEWMRKQCVALFQHS
jgi:DNA-binding transcriptional LysR family regulator